MPNTNAPDASSDDTSDNARQQRQNNLTDTKELYFLLDYATLSAEASEGITTIADAFEANELYQSKPENHNAAADALALSAAACKALQKLALLSVRMLGTYAVQEVELINARQQR